MNLRIDRVEKSKRKDGYILYFNDFTSLAITESLVVKFSLLPGRELTEAELKSIKSELRVHNARAKAAAMIGMRPLTEKELKKRLSEKGISQRDAEDAAEWLRDMGAVNDTEYAAALVRRYAAKGYGEAKIKDEFYKRGVSRELWDAALENYCANEDSIDRLLKSKLKNGTDKKEIKKASDALYRRGFSWDDIRGALTRYNKLCEMSEFDMDDEEI